MQALACPVLPTIEMRSSFLLAGLPLALVISKRLKFTISRAILGQMLRLSILQGIIIAAASWLIIFMLYAGATLRKRDKRDKDMNSLKD